MVRILIRVVPVDKIIGVNHVLPVEWMNHLMRHIVLVVWRWRLQSRWVHRADLGKRWVALLCILSESVIILVRVVNIPEVIGVHSVFEDDWFLHLVWNIVLVVWGWWLKPSWMHWVYLGE